jgi:SpoVK/Ycf46/Vps4 family AAA+-type ATPase
MPVLVLKNLRSQWFGQTDVIFERLKRALEALDRVCIFMDEADTQFGGVGKDTHETERRLTGKVQQMMSDPRLKGKVIWLLMTARINLLSPDIRRPGRAGDLILPVLDPTGQDREDFVRWALQPLAEHLKDAMNVSAVRFSTGHKTT